MGQVRSRSVQAATTRGHPRHGSRSCRPRRCGSALMATCARDSGEGAMPLIPPTCFGDVTLDHARMGLTGPRGSQRLPATEYRLLVSLLNQPTWSASAGQISKEARDAECTDDLIATRKCVERLNRALRVVSGRVAVSWAIGWIALTIQSP
jgi:hypothetical protein